jgi:hypothetical protein
MLIGRDRLHWAFLISSKVSTDTKEQSTNDRRNKNKDGGEQARASYTLHHRHGKSNASKHQDGYAKKKATSIEICRALDTLLPLSGWSH